MTEHKFVENDEVLVVGDDSDFKGQWGRVLKYEAVFERYFVFLPDVHKAGHYSAFSEDELELLPEVEEEVIDSEPEEDQDTGLVIDVPPFGIPAEDFADAVAILLGRTMSRVGQIGPEQIFMGYQQFEGQTPQEVLIGLLEKLEESMIMTAQLHILVARIGAALHQVHPEESS
jgi:hypothetical protein